MTRRAFTIGSWATLLAGAVTALAAGAIIVVGTLALAGKVTYPVDIGVGPVSLHHEVSMPVAFGADVCQSASVYDQAAPSDCLRFFVHDDTRSGSQGAVRVQDADIRPESAMLSGTVELATTGGWSAFVAASVARAAVGLAVISGVLLLLWRLLARSAAGSVFSRRAVTYVRGIGWLLIAGSLVDLAFSLFTALQLGYEIETFGSGPHLSRVGDGSIDLAQLALGGLVLLLGEVFRHGASVELENRLTV